MAEIAKSITKGIVQAALVDHLLKRRGIGMIIEAYSDADKYEKRNQKVRVIHPAIHLSTNDLYAKEGHSTGAEEEK